MYIQVFSALCILPNGQTVLSVVTLTSPNQHIRNFFKFIHFVILHYCEGGSGALKKNYHILPMLLNGDFNADFNSPNGEKFITFFVISSTLTMSSDKIKTTIDRYFSGI